MISRRRLAFPLFGLYVAAQAFAQGGASAAEPKVDALESVPQYGMFEVKISGLPKETKDVGMVCNLLDSSTDNYTEGFRDGDLWRVRFMPSSQGKYEYAITVNGGDWTHHDDE